MFTISPTLGPSRLSSVLSLLVFAGLSACVDKSPPPGETGEERPTLDDKDEDGYSSTTDCDDNDAAVNPGVDEACNGVDDDCDGSTDEEGAPGGELYYPDADGDGTGAADGGVRRCDAPTGWVTDGTDCDDGNAAVSPLATESCDDIDNDCDGEVDEEGSEGGLAAYYDADGDSYGDPDQRAIVCGYPDGYVANDEDCDDNDADIKPGAEERCDNDDNDCDGETDEDAVDMDTWYVDSDGDGYGVPDSTTTSCDRPAGYASTDTDCDDSDLRVYPGAIERCDDSDNDCDGETDEDARDADTYYPDADLDGYGTDDGALTQCDEPDGDYSTTGGDCDDDDSAVNPGAEDTWYDGVDTDCDEACDFDQDADGYVPDEYAGMPTTDPGSGEDVHDGSSPTGDCDDTNNRTHPGMRERCDDVDNDCDGETDEDAIDGTSWYTDGDGDGYGGDDSEIVTCESPGDEYIEIGGDCDDDNTDINPDAPEDATDGVDNDCDGRTDETTSEMTGFGYFLAGFYTGGWDCIEYYTAVAYELSVECDSCDFSWEVQGTWEEGALESSGYDSCGLDSFAYWSGDEEFTSDWSFAYDPVGYPYPVAYYGYSDAWYPVGTLYYATGSYYGDYLQWLWHYDYTGTGEVELFLLYKYSY